MSEPITIELVGELALVHGDGCMVPNLFEIGDKSIDASLADFLGYARYGRTVAVEPDHIGRCELTLKIWPKEQGDGQA